MLTCLGSALGEELRVEPLLLIIERSLNMSEHLTTEASSSHPSQRLEPSQVAPFKRRRSSCSSLNSEGSHRIYTSVTVRSTASVVSGRHLFEPLICFIISSSPVFHPLNAVLLHC